MFDKLKELTKDTAIYGISTIVGRFLNFILVPFYTNIFAPSEYGIIQLIYAYIGILIIVCVYGLDSAFLKYAAFKDFGDEKDNFSTPFISIVVTSVVFTGVIALNTGSIGNALSIPQNYFYLIYMAAALIAFDAIGVVPFLKLRLERKAAKFSTIKIINICVNLILNIYLILFLGWGIEAILVSNLAASFVSLLLLLPTIVNFIRLRFHIPLFKRLLKFGLPYLPGGLAVMVVQVIDVPILEKLTDLGTVGIYKANYKLGIFMMLFVSMFQYAWQPFFLQNAKDPQAKEMFSKVLSYFTLVGSIILVFLSLFITDLAKIQIEGYSLIGSKYWAGLNIVPIILLAYLINGMYVIFSAGIYIEEKSIYVPLIAGSGAIINIVANFSLIPILNITGAALATLASYLVMAAGYYFVTQKFYKVKYELRRIGKIFLAVFLVGITYYYLLLSENLLLLYKLLILIGFGLFIYFIAVDRAEINLIRKKLLESRKK
ncbi:MAG: oligosaccharide flippase family protein [Ignavibacteria bacterium]|nr:oligosaccharide flippase family protein [Ignavibacteria bacterium]MBT8383605.1 oligosaccharide flippase family protein [Ignavibacteria bacterium]MBT8390731.1 oligosaccharide flippase family protein [Ignavibacteria bacterium]NNJ53492.1 oligosaccharide flippase family protein [Ignavibacteriaceae bacterium]NNL20950.1 oligosaccharide flippase family protein [Ignavibacteriaceae bacterium]